MKGVRLTDVTLDLGAGAGVVSLLGEGTLVLVSPIQIQGSQRKCLHRGLLAWMGGRFDLIIKINALEPDDSFPSCRGN